MKGIKRSALQVFVVMCVVCLLAACASGGGSGSSGSSAGGSSSGSQATAGTGTSSGSSGSSGSAGAKTGHTFRLGHPVSDQAVSGVTAISFSKAMEEKTNGRVKVEVYGGSVLGNEISMLEQVQVGSLEIASTSLSALTNFVPELKLLDMPFLFRDREHVYKTLDGEVGQELAQYVEKAGFKLLSFGEIGFKIMSNSKREIRAPEDIKGLKIRTQQNDLIVDTFRALGADPTPVPFAEVYTAVQQGVVDGVDMGYVPFADLKLYEIQEYISELQIAYNAAVMVMNLDLFNSLDEEVQNALLAAGEEHTKEQRELTQQAEVEIVKTAADAGAAIVKASELDMAPFQQAVASVYEKYKEFDDLVAKIRNVK
mgnify:CR=1 FL=1